MSRFKPRVLRGGEWGGDGNLIGGGSAQGGVTAQAMSFADWCASGYSDGWDFGEPGLDWDDFYDWWIINGLSEDEWYIFNPGVSFPP